MASKRSVLYVCIVASTVCVWLLSTYYRSHHDLSRNLSTFAAGERPPMMLRQPPPKERQHPPAGKLTPEPNLTLTVRMAAKPALLKHFYCSMLRSAALFWSAKYGPITLILDKESAADHTFEHRLRRQASTLGLAFEFRYEPLPPGLTKVHLSKHPLGYDRQLWSFFHMDLFVSAPVVALTDTDAMFTTPVTPENIFTGNRLRVIGMEWINLREIHKWAKSTEAFLGKKMVADFMSYFPNYIWRDTITNCREYCLKYLKVNSIEEAVEKLTRKLGAISVCPISIVMSYAYYFEYERYDWHLDISNLDSFKKSENFPPGLTSRDTTPYIHVTIHEKHYFGDPFKEMKASYCAAKQHVARPASDFCEEFGNSTSWFLFKFHRRNSKQDRNHLHTWCGGEQKQVQCRALIQSHYQNADRYYRAGWYDLNVDRVFAVEKAASEFNINCPKVFEHGAV